MLYGDYHTHTPYSHGTGTVMENAMVAKEKGLKELAITDHGFNHMAFAIKRKELKSLRKDIDEAENVTGLKIYLGVEANIISKSGKVDVKPKDFKYLELLVVGYHKAVWSDPKSEIDYILKNMIIKNQSKKMIESNTRSYIKALRKYPIDIISHLNHHAKVDVVAVAKVAEEVGCYIELNGKRKHFSKEQVRDMVEQTNCMFVLDSDAHSKERVGEVTMWMELAKEYGIPKERIANLNGGIKLRDKKAFYETKR